MAGSYKNYLILVANIILIFGCTCPQNQNNSIETKDIKSVLDSQIMEWNKGDISGFMTGYEVSDSLQFITKKGRTLGWKNVLEKYQKGYPTKKDMGELQFKNLIIKPLNVNLAQVYGNWEVKKDSVYSGNFSLIMNKTNHGWRIIIDHTW